MNCARACAALAWLDAAQEGFRAGRFNGDIRRDQRVKLDHFLKATPWTSRPKPT